MLSLLTAALGLGLGWGLPVWLLILLSPLIILFERLLTAGRRRQLRASAQGRKHSYAELGMLFGTFIGGGIGVTLVAITGVGSVCGFAWAGAPPQVD